MKKIGVSTGSIFSSPEAKKRRQRKRAAEERAWAAKNGPVTVTRGGMTMSEPETSVEYIRVFQGADNQWYYESVAANGQTLSTSEGYTQKHNAIGGAIREYGDGIDIKDKED